MSTILVIGGAGFVGSNLCNALAKAGHEVYSLDNYSTGRIENHVVGVAYFAGNAIDINSHTSLLEIEFDVVFHLGEYSRVEQSESEPFVALNGTIGTLLPVIEFCHKKTAKLIYSGSSTRFGDAVSPYSIGDTSMPRL